MMIGKIDNIRNFSIIAHINHGKSTLADCLIETCGGLKKKEITSQVLDSMEIEQERGITIKAQTVRLCYKAQNGIEYILNLIDTPGHIDFSYEVSRSLAACEGSVLVVDIKQGVEAQTLANAYKAIESNHEVIVALNKVDLPMVDVDKVKLQIEELIGLDTSSAVLVSAKTGFGIHELLEAIVRFLPAPSTSVDSQLKAMLVDSWYNQYFGIVILVRIIDGILKKGAKVKMMAANVSYGVENVGIFTPKKVLVDKLVAGEVGFITVRMKSITECHVGDTITEEKNPCNEPFPGFKESQPVVFCSLYPRSAAQFYTLKDGIAKLKLNDASFQFEMESSRVFGLGFKCGFLGLLHLEIIRERIEREFNLNIIITAPSVVYYVHLKSGQVVHIHNAIDMPDFTYIDYVEEPLVKTTIIVPEKYLGSIFALCTERRGIQNIITYVRNRVMVVYELPLNEIIYDFCDKLKSCSRGYASFDWKISHYLKGDLIKMNILLNGEIIDALSLILHRSYAETIGRKICLKLKDLIPKHMFSISIQAAIGSKIIARETLNAIRKDVTAKCYGGDVTRKIKLLQKQKQGKRKMRAMGCIEVPQSVFISILKVK